MSVMRRALAGCSALTLCACSGPQNFMNPAGPAAGTLASLGWFTLILFAAISAAVWILIAWIALRRRGSFDEHAPVSETKGQNWIVIFGIAIPAAVLVLVFVLTVQAMDAFPMGHAHGAHAQPNMRVTGQQWWFDAEYLFADPSRNLKAPTELHVPVGRPVTIELVTRDVIHSFWVPKLHGKVDLVPGMKNLVRIQADRPGVYDGECAEFCGMQHAQMRLQVVAQTPQAFEAWLDAQRAPAAEPASARARLGREVFLTAACPLCHTVRGTPALGTVGPDLTHVASRRTIAGGALGNDTANLSAWVTHAQSLKPGVEMPNLTQFTGEQLNALVAYLQSLE